MVLLPGAAAQAHRCGEIQIVFKNPDLQPSDDGYIRAQGQFFAQFQAIGPEADRIEVFGFSFGPLVADVDEAACDQPLWVTGQAVVNYRADRDPADGFFIPLVTPLVPDGEYTAAVHAYDGDDNELARFWAKAIVDNCDGAPPSRCTDDAAQHTDQDRTAPWPMVLPGDGQALEGRRLTIEFGEPIENLTVTLNGADITGELVEWEGRIWDADLSPDYGPYGVGGMVSEPCTQPYHTCMKYGPAYEWAGRPLTDADVVRVEATDLAGNLAVKDIHVGSSVAGGAVTEDVPILGWTADRTELDVAPGQAGVFRFTIENSGGGTGHPFATALGPEGWDLEWQPEHVPVPPGESRAQEFVVTAPVGTAPGAYPVNATMSYEQAGRQNELAQRLTVSVGGGAVGTAGPGGEDLENETDKGSPLPLASAALALGAVALLRRRQA